MTAVSGAVRRKKAAARAGARGGARLTGNVRVGGRSERVVRDVLSATIAQLGRHGYAALTIEGVAEMADVNRTTIYRRWPTKADLVGAAVRAVAERHEEMADTGSVRGDMLAELDRLVRFIRTDEGRAITRLITTERGDPAINRLARELREASFARRAAIVTRAKERGELPATANARLILDAIFTTVASRVIRFDEDVDAETRAALVDLVVTGAEHGGGRASR